MSEILYKGHKRNLIRISDERLVKMSDHALKGVLKSIRAVKGLLEDHELLTKIYPHPNNSMWEKERWAALNKVTMYSRAVRSVINLRKHGHEDFQLPKKQNKPQRQLRRRT